ncbi:EAL domain-containing protein, partial [Escherichia coli]|uniref:EAL domain-containing protein n=1 Tax=Escherichia coli TaxID=562 RepID=UPI0013D7BB9F
FNDASRLLTSICKALDLSGLPGERLELEITEGVMLADTDTVSAIISRCRKLGVGIALDDFGAGYCSLSYLNRVPFEKI